MKMVFLFMNQSLNVFLSFMLTTCMIIQVQPMDGYVVPSMLDLISPFVKKVFFERALAQDNVTALVTLCSIYQESLDVVRVGEYANTLAHLAAIYKSPRCLFHMLTHFPHLVRVRNSVGVPGMFPLVTLLSSGLTCAQLPHVSLCILLFLDAESPFDIAEVGNLTDGVACNASLDQAVDESMRQDCQLLKDALAVAQATYQATSQSDDHATACRRARAVFAGYYPNAAAHVAGLGTADAPQTRMR